MRWTATITGGMSPSRRADAPVGVPTKAHGGASLAMGRNAITVGNQIWEPIPLRMIRNPARLRMITAKGRGGADVPAIANCEHHRAA
jgi:hypothetical protein